MALTACEHKFTLKQTNHQNPESWQCQWRFKSKDECSNRDDWLLVAIKNQVNTIKITDADGSDGFEFFSEAGVGASG
jgi:hypothetical protein